MKTGSSIYSSHWILQRNAWGRENVPRALEPTVHSRYHSSKASSLKILLKCGNFNTCINKTNKKLNETKKNTIRYFVQFIPHHQYFYSMILLWIKSPESKTRLYKEYLAGAAQSRQVHPKVLLMLWVDSSPRTVPLLTSVAWLPCSVLHSLSAESWFMVSGSGQECSHWKLRTIFTLDQPQPLCSIKTSKDKTTPS